MAVRNFTHNLHMFLDIFELRNCGLRFVTKCVQQINGLKKKCDFKF